jgi:hypothetical protein
MTDNIVNFLIVKFYRKAQSGTSMEHIIRVADRMFFIFYFSLR